MSNICLQCKGLHRAMSQKCFKSKKKKFDQIIVYNDASKDETLKCVKKVAADNNTVKIVDSQINRGPGGGKNYAVLFVETDYFMFVDADDYISNNYLEILSHELENLYKNNYNFPDILISGFCGVNNNGAIRYKRNFKDSKSALYQSIANWGKLFKKKFWTEHNLRIPSGKVLEDVLLRTYIVGCDPIVAVTNRTSGYYYCSNPSSVSNTYMNNFIEGVGKQEFEYLSEQYSNIEPYKHDEYIYWCYKVFCWHILKSGSGVGWKKMKNELIQMRHLLQKSFPEYKENPYLTGKKKLSEERKIVSIAVRGMYKLETIHFQKVFLFLYSIVNLRHLWPKL